jgi:adenosylcobinamide kinase/adenosylcobinamide-phosphate guanylyltransferase
MLHVVTGASASGKSEYAEKIAVECFHKNQDESCAGSLYYVAAMKPYGDEAEKRIERHHKLRAGKGFETLEIYTHLEQIHLRKVHAEDVFLIECMSNLLANEIYEHEGGLKNITVDENCADEKRLYSVIVSPIIELSKAVKDVVVVTNDIFSDGRHFTDEHKETEEYCRLLGCLNIMLAQQADTVTEVVCGIPNIIKE